MVVLPLQSGWAAVTLPCTPESQALVHVLSEVAPSMGAALAEHDAHAAHHGHGLAEGASPPGVHDAAAASGADSERPSRCDASAACISLHSPPLAIGLSLGVPPLPREHGVRVGDAPRFRSAVLALRHRPPILRAA